MELATSAGLIAVDLGEGMVRARGVAYGRARRFEAGRAVEPWPGRRAATSPGPACPQRAGRLDFVTGPVVDHLRVDEDCLVLSVTAPQGAAGLPVMVWFHGGAYVAGGGESAKYDPTPLVRDGDVVVVTVTYRLGIFGYLAPADSDADDNIGLRDQILALQWVRDNVAAFGGNPDDVTVFGQSAGGDSVIALMLSDGTDGLFHRVIAQSAPLGVGTGTAAVAAGRAEMAVSMQAAMSDTLGGTLPREATIEQLLAAEQAAAVAAQRFSLLGGMAFAPRLGRYPLPTAEDLPSRLADAARRVELFIGYTKDDGAPFVAMRSQVAAMRPDRLRRQVIRAATRPVTMRVFGRGASEFVTSWRKAGGRAGTYRFDWAPPGAPFGACHCIELPYLFGTAGAWSDAPMLGPRRMVDDALGERLRSVWTGFARGGTDALSAPELRFG